MKPKIIIGVVGIVAALAFLIFSGFKDNAAYYLTVSELQARTDLSPQTGIRVHGFVDPGSIRWDAEAIELTFTLYEEGDSLEVYYQGVKPDQLIDAQRLVAEGHLGADGMFHASTIMLKCPSKYETSETNRYDKAAL